MTSKESSRVGLAHYSEEKESRYFLFGAATHTMEYDFLTVAHKMIELGSGPGHIRSSMFILFQIFSKCDQLYKKIYRHFELEISFIKLVLAYFL